MTKRKVGKIEVPPLDKSTIALETQHDSSFGVGGNIDDMMKVALIGALIVKFLTPTQTILQYIYSMCMQNTFKHSDFTAVPQY